MSAIFSKWIEWNTLNKVEKCSKMWGMFLKKRSHLNRYQVRKIFENTPRILKILQVLSYCIVIKSDRGHHSQFLRCLFECVLRHFKMWSKTLENVSWDTWKCVLRHLKMCFGTLENVSWDTWKCLLALVDLMKSYLCNMYPLDSFSYVDIVNQ